MVFEDLDSIFERVGDVVWETDPELNFRYINVSVARVLDVVPADLAGKPVFTLLNPVTSESVNDPIREAFESRQLVPLFESWCLRKDGTGVVLQSSATPRFDEQGKFAGYFGISRDVTSLKRGEESHALLGALFEGTSDLLVVRDLESKILHANGAYLRACGRKDVSEVRGRFEPEVMAVCRDRGYSSSYMRDEVELQLLRPGEVLEREESLFTPERKRRFLLARKFPVYSTAGELAGLATLSSDITAMKEQQRALLHSERRFSMFMEHIPAQVYLKNQEGRFLYVNNYMKTHLGAAGWVGKTTEECCPRSLGREVAEEDRRTLESGIFSSERELTDAKGTRKYYRMHQFRMADAGEETLVGGIGLDLTSLKVTEKALRESKEFSANLAWNVPNPVIVFNRRSEITYLNPAFEQMTGFVASELLGRPAPYPWWPEERQRLLMRLHQELLKDRSEGRHVCREERLFLKKNGQTFWADEQTVLCFEEGEFLFGISTWVDVTAKKADRERILEEKERRYRHVFEGSLEAICLFSAGEDGVPERLVDANAAFCSLLGRGLEEVLRWGIGDLFTEGECPFRELPEGQRGVSGETVLRDASGKLVPFEFQAALLALEGRNFWLFSGRDISHRKEIEEQERLYRRQLRALASQLTITEERERREISREIHDSIGQMLALAKIKLGVLGQKLGDSSRKEIGELRGFLDSSINCTRNLTFELGTPVLYELGFEASLEWLASLFASRHGFEVRCRVQNMQERLGEDLRFFLFRSARELLYNAVKYAGVSRALLTVRKEEDRVLLEVKDQGRGFDPSPILSGWGRPGEGVSSFGLFSILERVRYLGGDMEVHSSPGEGTKVLLQVPYAAAASPAMSAGKEGAGAHAENSVS